LCDRFDAMAEANIEIDFMRDLARQLPAMVIADMLAIDPSYQSNVVVELHGQRMKKGRRVIALIGAANRDPAKFTDPARLDLARNQGNHLSFGYGPHVCIGAQLDAVLTPAFDGGYVLLGLARAMPADVARHRRGTRPAVAAGRMVAEGGVGNWLLRAGAQPHA
jgi:hypothetical protein